MRGRIVAAGLFVLLTAFAMSAQVPGDVMGVHNLGPGSKSPITGTRSDSCSYCHAPHSGKNIGLWNQTLTTKSYTTYTSDTEKNKGVQPALGSDSNMCLSCHDGSVAVGSTVVYGQVAMQGAMDTKHDVFGPSMQSMHPFSLVTPLKDNIHLAASLAASGKTADPSGAVKLISGSVECTSCHNPHVQARDVVSQNFLVKDGSSGQLCLACHDPARTGTGQVNPLANWATSAHSTSAAKITSTVLGSYTTVATDACISCHAPHNGAATARLLRAPDDQDCLTCHSGSGAADMKPYTNILSELAPLKVSHPYPTTSSNPHDASEAALLNNNRHATCVDCHNGHSAQPVQVFPGAPLVRLSQKDVQGVSATDGTTVLTPAVNQYESCLRCHGSSAGKQVVPTYGYFPVRAASNGDPLNLIPQFTGKYAHPVMHARNSSDPQPSLLANMLNLDGVNPGRAMGTQILCTDCHNSDDNREFGGGGPNGPHGSKWTHILERRYEFSQAVTPGTTITNLFPTPDLSVNGPYAMCAKCHDLPNQIMQNTSWTHHSQHINTGISCSVCHTAHGGVGANIALTGERLVNFDRNVVASNNGLPISYNHAANTCQLVCHGATHNLNGSVSAVRIARGPVPTR